MKKIQTLPVNILSLFDGISCARVALEKLGVEVGHYYASEIDKYAIEISKRNYPDIEHIGSVDIVRGISDIDILVGGSPCQDLSSIGKGKGLVGSRSGLFYEYVRILKEVKPTFFILENVASMSKENRDIISKELGVQPILINAGLVSAQNRKRYFWVGKINTNGEYVSVDIKQPQDRKEYLVNITENDVEEKYYFSKKRIEFFLNRPKNYSVKINPEKSNTLRTNYGNASANETYIKDKKGIRKMTPVECERLQGLPDNYTFGVSNTQRYKALGNAFNADVIAHIIKHFQ